jgi:transcriptional regulator with XRE-family HTH domain
MDRSFLLGIARRARGLTQVELAAISGTSQATLSQYERGLKSPSLKVASRILAAMGYEFTLRAHVDWVEHHPTGIVKFWAPSMLWAVEPPTCFATLHIPDEIRNTGMRTWNLRDRDERRGVYEQLIRRGLPQQMIRWMDGGLLVDLWDELDLPDPVRDAWASAIRLATAPLELDGLRSIIFEDGFLAPRALIRDYQVIPAPPPPPPRRQRRTRFDPRPLPPEDQIPRPGPRDDGAGGP